MESPRYYRVTFPDDARVRELSPFTNFATPINLMECILGGKEAWLSVSSALPPEPPGGDTDQLTAVKRQLETHIPAELIPYEMSKVGFELTAYRLMRYRVKGEDIDLVHFMHPNDFGNIVKDLKPMDLTRPEIYAPPKELAPSILLQTVSESANILTTYRCEMILNEVALLKGGEGIKDRLRRQIENEIKGFDALGPRLEKAILDVRQTMFGQQAIDADLAIGQIQEVCALVRSPSAKLEEWFKFSPKTNLIIQRIWFLSRMSVKGQRHFLKILEDEELPETRVEALQYYDQVRHDPGSHRKAKD